MVRTLLRISVTLLLFAAAQALAQTASSHVKGPHNLEGWTLPDPCCTTNNIAGTLEIARDGKVIAKFQGDPFIWKWIFVDDGTKIALESGPFHFGMACVLEDLATAKELERVDCFRYPHESPQGGWPGWVHTLESSQ